MVSGCAGFAVLLEVIDWFRFTFLPTKHRTSTRANWVVQLPCEAVRLSSGCMHAYAMMSGPCALPHVALLGLLATQSTGVHIPANVSTTSHNHNSAVLQSCRGMPITTLPHSNLVCDTTSTIRAAVAQIHCITGLTAHSACPHATALACGRWPLICSVYALCKGLIERCTTQHPSQHPSMQQPVQGCRCAHLNCKPHKHQYCHMYKIQQRHSHSDSHSFVETRGVRHRCKGQRTM
jgi:hypothetical protein